MRTTTKELELGAKVKYHTGNEKWRKGVVHAVRKVDDVNGEPRVLAYVIDTGNDERLDVYEHDLKNLATSKEYDKQVSKGKEMGEALQIAVKATEDMPSEIVQTVERQPEQVDVRADWVKAL